jgi:hypothetical protein
MEPMNAAMATHFQIQELASGLRVQARQDLPRWERLLVAGIVAGVVGIPSASFVGGWWWALLSAIAAAATYGSVKNTSAELQVTNVEFISKGNLGRRIQTPRIVCTGDVRRIEFREGSSPLTSRLEGLYALTDRQELCLLPYLDWEQTEQVIQAIEKKFPGMSHGWRSERPFTELTREGSGK